MKKLLVLAAGIAALGFVGTASAADMPTKAPMMMAPVYNWTGFYVGINGGAGWGRTNQTNAGGVTSGSYNQSGGIVGGTLGYNWQVNNIVVGIEGDMDWANINGTSTAATCAGSCWTNLKWLATVRPRLGLAWGMWMPFVTGGVAFGSVDTGCCGGGPALSTTATRTGWTVGGGVEVMFAPRWSAKLEYLYADLGNTTYAATAIVVPEKVSVVRGGINYHF
ncbi:MAG TPA: outer membrane protein [Pseudolabrys sp.]